MLVLQVVVAVAAVVIAIVGLLLLLLLIAIIRQKEAGQRQQRIQGETAVQRPRPIGETMVVSASLVGDGGGGGSRR